MFQIKTTVCNVLAHYGKKGFSAARRVATSAFFQKVCMFVVMFMLVAIDTWASSTGAGGFTRATTEIASYQTPVSNLMKAIAAVIVLVGAFNVYFKMQNGDQDVKKTIMLFINKCKILDSEIFKKTLYLIGTQYFKLFSYKIEIRKNLNVFMFI